MLSPEELKRYHRHIILPEIGLEGQAKLRKAKVLVIGAGGLGCPVLQYLAAAGVGTIGIVDDDLVEESNLHRQILYSNEDLGQSKALIAAEKITKLNPLVKVRPYATRLSTENALKLLKNYDIVVDGSDNFPTRYLVNDACVILKKPLVFGSVFKFDGQISVLNYQGGPTYRCLFPEPPGDGEVPDCSQTGVLGVLPGIIGTFQANEVLKMLLETGEVLSGKLLILNALTMANQIFTFSKNPKNTIISELSSYEQICETKKTDQITVHELAKWISENRNIQLIDVREPHEYQLCRLKSSELIPLDSIPAQFKKISMDRKVVVYCHHGMRSQKAIDFLKKNFGFKNLFNLKGGIEAWAKEIDPVMTRY